jgi:hypothetical protein
MDLMLALLPAKLFPTTVQNTAWGDTAGPPGAGCTLKHHSLDPYGEHATIQQQMIRCLDWKDLQFHLGFAPCMCQTFPTAVQNTAWGDTAGPPGAGCTLEHRSFNLYGGHGMVQQQLIRCLG